MLLLFCKPVQASILKMINTQGVELIGEEILGVYSIETVNDFLDLKSVRIFNLDFLRL